MKKPNSEELISQSVLLFRYMFAARTIKRFLERKSKMFVYG